MYVLLTSTGKNVVDIVPVQTAAYRLAAMLEGALWGRWMLPSMERFTAGCASGTMLLNNFRHDDRKQYTESRRDLET